MRLFVQVDEWTSLEFALMDKFMVNLITFVLHSVKTLLFGQANRTGFSDLLKI